MYILGLSYYYHDAAAALIKDGQLIAAAEEERFSRKKHDSAFPKHAIDFCFSKAGISGKDLDYVGFYDKPLLKFERILSTYLTTFPRGYKSYMKAMPVWLKEKMWVPQSLRKSLNYSGPLIFSEHHLSHAASAFLVSPFNEAAILTVDGVGEWETTTLGVGTGNSINLLKCLHFPHSLGLLYSAFTYYLGFKVNSAEYKVMGLAPYGRPIYYDLIMRELLDLREDGSFKINMKYFAYDYGLTMTNKSFNRLFGSDPREPETELTQFHKDVAASQQKVTEEILIRMANYLYSQTGLDSLCMAGGVALNCVSNSKILSSSPFRRMFVQPAASDAGGSVGVAYYVYNTVLKNERNFVWTHNFLGSEYSDDDIEQDLKMTGVQYRKMDRASLLEETARILADQNVVGWFQGRMEFGPRGLGNRSILADPRNAENRSRVNLKVKFRESFRPFAPSVLRERTAEYFDTDRDSPFMLFTAQVRQDRRVIPAVTHADGSARLQTVSRDDNALFYDLLKAFESRTGCPVLINTSLNVRGEPIVCTPREAIHCFLRTELDYLAIGNFLLDKKTVGDSAERLKWEEIVAAD